MAATPAPSLAETAPNAQLVPPFEYGVLAPAVAEKACQAARTILGIERRMRFDIIAIGRELSLVREVLNYGLFGKWIATEFGYTDRTARNYMSVYQVFGDSSETVSGLRPSTLYKLAAPSTPTTIRTEILGKLEAGEALDDETIKIRVAKAMQTERAKAKARKVNPNAEKLRQRRLAKEQREAREQQQRGAAQKTAAAAAVNLLVEHLGDHLREFDDLLKLATYQFSDALRDRLDKIRRGPSTPQPPSDE